MSRGWTGTGEVAFIVTKPLQIMICMAICDQLELSQRSHLLVVTSFHEAEAVLQRIREHDPRWLSVSAYLTRRDAVVECVARAYEMVFVDTDVGPQSAWELRRLKKSVPGVMLCVYEEGLGTYRDDLCSARGVVLMRALGASTHFGGLAVTDEIWLFQPELYASQFPRTAHKVRAIEPNLDVWISTNRQLLESAFLGAPLDHIFPENARGGRCALYLTSWTWRPELCETITSWGGPAILKMHPHIEEDAPALAALFDVVVPARVPAELVVLALARRFDDVAVFHHGSSTAAYVYPRNVTYFKMS